MAIDLDNFPVYDDLVKPNTEKLSDVWSSFLAGFIQTLKEYISQNGFFVPQITTQQRDAIKTPIGGQLIYNTTTKMLQVYKDLTIMPHWFDIV